MDITGRLYQCGADRFVALSVPNLAAIAGQPKQMRSVEMLHWDDYCQKHALSTGTQPMMRVFDTHFATEASSTLFDVDGKKYQTRSVVVVPHLKGSATQLFCCEMMHWDDICEDKGMRAGNRTMAERFKPFVPLELLQLDTSKAYDSVTRTMGWSVALVKLGESYQPYCCEMLHWDEYQSTKGTPNAPTMFSLFGQA